jgi:hypothetical protein
MLFAVAATAIVGKHSCVRGCVTELLAPLTPSVHDGLCDADHQRVVCVDHSFCPFVSVVVPNGTSAPRRPLGIVIPVAVTLNCRSMFCYPPPPPSSSLRSEDG